MKRSRKIAAAAAAALLVAAFAERTLSLSARRPAPVYDEVAYLDSARGFAQDGGVLAGIACHLKGACLEDNRHPLYALLAAPWMAREPEPADFARAKLVALAGGLLLLAAAFFAASAAGGLEAGLAALALLAFSSELSALSAQAAADALFAALYVAALAVLARAGADRRRWLAFGLLAGLAYLAKASGQFLLLSAAFVAARRWGKRTWKRPEAGLALAGFALAAGFLLYRNAAVWGNPLHNINSKALWLDDISQEWPEIEAGWRDAGPLRYWRAHSLADVAGRLRGGLVTVSASLVAACGTGPLDAGVLVSVLSGVLVLALLAGGLRAAWRSKERDDVLAPLASGVPMLLVLCWGAAAGMVGTRFFVPILASLIPAAARGLPSRARRTLIAAGALAAVATLLRGDGFAADPRAFWAVTPETAEASRYVAGGVDEAGFLLPYESSFSTWDRGRDKRRLFPYDLPDGALSAMMRRHGISHVFLDTSVPSATAEKRRLGRADAFGPTSFMGWPRCFHDSGKPSRLLAYAPDCRPARP